MRAIVPGVAFSAALAVGIAAFAPILAHVFPIPPMVLALLVGMALNPFARWRSLQPGIEFCVRQILRWAVAMLGLRIALGEILALGLETLVLVLASMAITVAVGLACARWSSQPAPYGALAGASTAVCGASAALAAAAVLPPYRGKEVDVAFVVVAVNALSTIAMIAYPVLCAWLGLDDRATGVMLGATIHDVAQVVGAGYSVSETAGNTAVIVKLFRVFMLLPVILTIAWWFARRNGASRKAGVQIPGFAVAFLVLCLINTGMLSFPTLLPLYEQIKPWLIEVSAAGLLVVMVALGLRTSLTEIADLGWRHVATMTGTTLAILVAATAGLLLLH
jgi:uncharacterized integral membrane protein (TIGR00698 family)